MMQLAAEIQELRSNSETEMTHRIELLRLQLDEERLSIERSKFQSEQKFLVKNFGAVLAATISLVAVLVSGTQVWVAKIQKDKELAVVASARDRELKTAQAQKQNEETRLQQQQDRAWRLDLARFIAENRAALFGKNEDQREFMRNLILKNFPTDISRDYLVTLEINSSSPEEKRELRRIRQQVLPQIKQTVPPLIIAAEEAEELRKVLGAPDCTSYIRTMIHESLHTQNSTGALTRINDEILKRCR